MGNGLWIRVTQAVDKLPDAVLWPAVAGLLWLMHRITRAMYRDDRDAMRQINEGLLAENARLKVELEQESTRKKYYRDRAHKLGNEIFDMADQLSEACLENGILRHRLGLPVEPATDLPFPLPDDDSTKEA